MAYKIRYALLIFISALFFSSIVSAEEVKRADLAGSWYPSSRNELELLISGYFKMADPEPIDGDPIAIISPHAGYRFSGPVAAYGFKAVQGKKNIKTVILIGFSHRKSFNGISVYDRGSFETPFGAVKVDEALAKDIISRDSRMRFYPELFKEENSIETEIPFIQFTFRDALIVPIAFGGQSFDDADALAKVLSAILKGRDDCIIVASTDLSHYHSYEEANSIDMHLVNLLKTLKAGELYDETRLGLSEMCGVMPVTAVLLTAKELGYDSIKVLKYANSGDTSGEKNKVVGYLSAVIYKKSSVPGLEGPGKENGVVPMLSNEQRKRLLQIARESISSYVKDGRRKEFSETDPVLKEEFGAFVTLHERGELRGCIGNMIGEGPLYRTVADMAIEAAVGDPRFEKLSAGEVDNIDIEISVLSPLKRVKGAEDIKIPGDGVLVRKGYSSGVYLPQVADETGWSKEEFLTSLCAHKAGLQPDAWKDPATEMYKFTAEVFGEKEASKR